MAKKFTLNKKTLKALFDYNSFSPNQRLEQFAQESLARVGSLNVAKTQNGPVKMPEPLEAGALEALAAAGDPSKGDLPHSPKLN